MSDPWVPGAFRIATVPGLLRTGSAAWRGYDEAARPLSDAIRKLVGER